MKRSIPVENNMYGRAFLSRTKCTIFGICGKASFWKKWRSLSTEEFYIVLFFLVGIFHSFPISSLEIELQTALVVEDL